MYDMNFHKFEKFTELVQNALKITSNYFKYVCFAHFWAFFKISVSNAIHKIQWV